MNQEIAFSSNRNTEMAVQEIFQQLKSVNYKVVIFFASVSYDFSVLSQKLKEKYSNSQVIGVSTSGEITNKGLFKNSLVVTTMNDETSRFSSIIIDDADKFPIVYKREIEKTATSIGIRLHSNGANKDCFALTFINGLCNAEEATLSLLNSVIDDNQFNIIGGSAGDDLKFTQTFVSLNGKVVSHGAVVLFVKTSKKFIIKKENIFKPSGKHASVTGVDVENRIINSINNQNPKKCYANILGIPESSVADSSLSHPIGRVFGDEVFISSIANINQNGTISMYARILPGMEVEILDPKDIIETTKATGQEISSEIKRPGFILFVNCILRTIMFEKQHKSNDVIRAWNENYSAYCGFSSYGEQINRLNSNQTLLVLAIEA